MEVFWILIALAWIVIPIVARQKKQQAKEQAAREQAARQRAAQAASQQRVQQPMRTTPMAPTVRTTMQSSFEGAVSTEGTASSQEGTPAHTIGTTLSSKTTTLTQIRVDPEHVVKATSESGHTHEETSMTGVEPPCPPDQKPAAAASAQANAPVGAFVWDVSQAMSGLVMAEILGPCKALRSE